jgi:hypothetical protein
MARRAAEPLAAVVAVALQLAVCGGWRSARRSALGGRGLRRAGRMRHLLRLALLASWRTTPR